VEVLGVFRYLEEAIYLAVDFDFGTSDKWIEIHEYNGTDHFKIGEMDKSGWTMIPT